MNAADLAERLARELGIQPWQAARTVELLDAGNTIPFIARYRKEQTGELDEGTLRRLQERLEALRALEARRAEVMRLLAEQGNLTPELEEALRAADTLKRIEDLYLPYRPKRRTRASVAREKGLEPLAHLLLRQDWPADLPPQAGTEQLASRYLNPEAGVATPAEALAGAVDIAAEVIAEEADTRALARRLAWEKGVLASRCALPEDERGPTEYEMYYDYQEPVRQVRPHRVLAVNRGEKEGVLKVRIELPHEEILQRMKARWLPPESKRRATQRDSSPPHPLRPWLERAVEEGYRRLLAPSLEREIRSELTERAGEHAIGIFAANLRQLLMQPPVPRCTVIGIDPGYRTGCKVAVVGPTGEVLETATIYPHPPQRRWEEALSVLERLVERHGATLLAIGNGTASRETEVLAAELVRRREGLRYLVVNEAGASVYSASPLAAEELPQLDVSLRGAVSIARRTQDPLAELVKIDPKSIGVGLYQHDVDQKRLAASLAAVVESCVNHVGVELNTASVSLLSYVSGITPAIARNIVEYRRANGPFTSRLQLLEVPRLGPKAFEQCAGFLRIANAADPLDRTAVHPESYPLARRIVALALSGETSEQPGAPRTAGSQSAGGGTAPGNTAQATGQPADSIPADPIAEAYATPAGQAALRQRLSALDPETIARQLGAGVPTVRDILDALARPGRDPREDLPPPLFREDVLELDDLRPGMVLQGTVTNVVDFGAFVDIGLKKAGLVHVSELADHYVRHPLDAVSVGQIVTVRVKEVDKIRERIALSMRQLPSDRLPAAE